MNYFLRKLPYRKEPKHYPQLSIFIVLDFNSNKKKKRWKNPNCEGLSNFCLKLKYPRKNKN